MNNFNYIEKRRGFSLALKRLCIEYKNYKCEICKLNYNDRSMCFHHIDESKKSFGINDYIQKYKHNYSKFSEFDFIALKNELNKCMLLCHNCHFEIHEKNDKNLRIEKIKKMFYENDELREIFNLKKKSKFDKNKNKFFKKSI